MLSLSLLNQGWGVPKHYLIETHDNDSNVLGTQDVGIHDNLARTDQDAFNEAGRIQLEHIFLYWVSRKTLYAFFSQTRLTFEVFSLGKTLDF